MCLRFYTLYYGTYNISYTYTYLYDVVGIYREEEEEVKSLLKANSQLVAHDGKKEGRWKYTEKKLM